MFFVDFKMAAVFLQNQSDAITAQSKTNRLMYSLTPLSFCWTVPLMKAIH